MQREYFCLLKIEIKNGIAENWLHFTKIKKLEFKFSIKKKFELMPIENMSKTVLISL